MAQAHIWTGRALYPEVKAVLDGLASISVSTVGERNDWCAEALQANVIVVAGETFVMGEVMDRNTICTPHIGSYTTASVLRMQVMACEQIASALRGERPTNLVNAQVWVQPGHTLGEH